MRRNRWNITVVLVSVALLSIIAAVLPSPVFEMPAQATGFPQLCVLPESTTVAERTVFTVEIYASGEFTELLGYNIAVTFDPTVVAIQSVDEGSLPLTSGFLTFFRWLNPSATDSVHVNGAILGNTVPGPGVLFTLTFQAADVAEDKNTTVQIVFSDIRNGVNEKITHTTKIGHVMILASVGTQSTTWGAIKETYR